MTTTATTCQPYLLTAALLLDKARATRAAVSDFETAAENRTDRDEHDAAVDLAVEAADLADLIVGVAKHALVHTATPEPAVADHTCDWCATVNRAAIHLAGDGDDQQHASLIDDMYVCAPCADDAIDAAVEQVRPGGQVVITPAHAPTTAA